ncbi:MAG: restriction endonuclease subunit S [Roseateles sp.]|uniref:restriction endonuclease subunit S n=1 Tax=Roseateles sp. TaxID=1971397 RepID=UPI004036F91A
MNSHIGKDQVKPMTQGVAQKKVSLGRFSKLAVPVPPLQEQVAILLKLHEAEREEQSLTIALERALQQSTAQRQNLLRAAFAGQLVPQDPADEPAAELLARIRAERTAAEPAAKRSRSRKVTA